MKNLFSTTPHVRRLALVLGGLLAGPVGAAAQTPPMTIFALGTVTQTYYTLQPGTQIIAQLNPANLSNTNSLLAVQPVPVTGVIAGQQLVGLDERPSTGQLYALGYNTATQAAQLYVLDGTTGVATAVGAPVTGLNLQDNDRNNTRGIVPNVGFDFNPRLDRVRIVAPNGTNYRVNPNLGGAAVADATLAYASGSTVGHAPYIGTAAYTNSALGVTGTTLYDIDVTNTNALLSIQAPPNAGVLNPVSSVTFMTNGNGNFYPLTSPTVGLDVDVFYDRSSRTNLAYLIEARYTDINNQDINNGGTTNQFSSNLWALNLANGQATGKNIFGRIPVFLSNIAAMTPVPKTWTGAVSTAWGTANNWYPVGVPTAADDVVIPGNGFFVTAANVTVTNQPTVSDAQQAASVNLISGAVLTTANGGTLNVNGDFVNNDSQVAGSGTGTVALVGSAAQDISGNRATTFQNLSVSTASATTSQAVSIVRALTATGNLAIGSGQPFTLLSNSAGTAYVVNNGGGAVTGTATVQRYITPTNAGAGYRHYSTPVSGNTVADFATTGYSPVVNPAYNSSATPPAVTPFPNIYTYDQARLSLTNSSPEFDKGFQSPATTADPLTVGLGYTVNIGAAELVDFMGTLNNGNYSRTGLARGPQATAGWQLLGNPYPGAISFTTLFGASSGIENGLYVFKSNGQYTGAYAAYVNGTGTNGGSDNVPLAQGFFVRVAAGQTGTVNFTNAARTNVPETALFQRTAADPRPALALTLRNASAANQTRVYFEQGATPAFDVKYDAHYLPATHGLDLASDISTEALAINGLPKLTGAVTVPLRVHAPAAGTYTLAVDELNNLPTGYHAYLSDATTGTYTDLATTPSLSLNLSSTDPATGRYAIVFSANAPLATASAALSAQASLYPSPAHGTATLVLPQALRGTSASTVQLLNALGQVVLTRTMAAGAAPSLELPLSGLAAGIYTVRATTAAGLVAKRLVVQ
ncbi:DUF4394 domain-containing protein [Hymenobacter sp. BRD128]|uniref:DUF4394 domain-containing protein n=1 Tax=Hymenobacter sp. BRD128 TaxID=2675878 RepID=UPI0015657AC0|nr:DUF4394 domain-containing protein [Hymenobacter sp. BRD128]QKG56345.1 DUF4394 domain-containing protein [Hymenobacter sp. BRD128]